MRFLLLFILLANFSFTLTFGQGVKQVVELNELKNHIDDSVMILATTKKVIRCKSLKQTNIILYDKFKRGNYITLIISDEIFQKIKSFDTGNIVNRYLRVNGVLRQNKRKFYIFISDTVQILDFSDYEPPASY